MGNLLCVAFVASQREPRPPGKIWSHIQCPADHPRENQAYELNDTPKLHQGGAKTEDLRGAQ